MRSRRPRARGNLAETMATAGWERATSTNGLTLAEVVTGASPWSRTSLATTVSSTPGVAATSTTGGRRSDESPGIQVMLASASPERPPHGCQQLAKITNAQDRSWDGSVCGDRMAHVAGTRLSGRRECGALATLGRSPLGIHPTWRSAEGSPLLVRPSEAMRGGEAVGA